MHARKITYQRKNYISSFASFLRFLLKLLLHLLKGTFRSEHKIEYNLLLKLLIITLYTNLVFSYTKCLLWLAATGRKEGSGNVNKWKEIRKLYSYSDLRSLMSTVIMINLLIPEQGMTHHILRFLNAVNSRKCYRCVSTHSWKDCDDKRYKVTCPTSQHCIKTSLHSSIVDVFVKGCAATCSASDIPACREPGVKCNIDCCYSDYCNGGIGLIN